VQTRYLLSPRSRRANEAHRRSSRTSRVVLLPRRPHGLLPRGCEWVVAALHGHGKRLSLTRGAAADRGSQTGKLEHRRPWNERALLSSAIPTSSPPVRHGPTAQSGTGRSTLWCGEVAESLVGTLRELAPDFVVHCGDFTQSSEIAQWEYGCEILDRVGLPLVPGPGNHDVAKPGNS